METFEKAEEQLRRERARWDGLGKPSKVSWESSARFGSTLSDVVEFSPVLTEAHELAGIAMREDEASASSALQATRLIAVVGSPTEDSRRAIARLGLAYKAFFFFVRSHQDALYGVLLNLLGQSAGPGARMSSASTEGNPVGDLLRREDPGYLPWFEKWRALRNAIKHGVALASLGPSGNPAVSFTHYTSEGGLVVDLDPKNAVRLSDAAEALVRTAAGVSVAADLAGQPR